ncbi:hypothetical protein AXG93_4776s1090 [Marchantia polymorpha subsp. ruderalis]|uniref:Uncharacterized protein n=1 Tax=Marchantia polymorpha subsp. ruderalis TaxID=1480154 RepID=A0A176VSK5_MARPO|nr:hypothetical protein AXG93_4776s1090 [Marchantia polymorpha subsp. ruderalis]
MEKVGDDVLQGCSFVASVATGIDWDGSSWAFCDRRDISQFVPVDIADGAGKDTGLRLQGRGVLCFESLPKQSGLFQLKDGQL